MICNKCETEKSIENFYSNDRKCKDCRKELVRLNRLKNAEYYREYDRLRYKKDPRVKKRHLKYQSTEKGKKALRKAHKKFIEQNPVKRAAHVILGNAVKYGKIQKKYFCEECLKTDGRIHGHHDDYSKPLEVRWLCPTCHSDWHQKNGEALNG